MRLERLDLVAFGPFTERTLELGDGGDALHVVYGPNEAGKSTALRAVSALLFGFPHQSRDAHLHPANRLLVGGRLRREDGEVLELLRRKGRKDTLLGPDLSPVPEAPLRQALGGATEEVFHTMFGLDHETLRRGAEALLAGRGDVGESLYEAALGGRGIHALLEELRGEADGLYRRRARKARIPAALDELKAAGRRVKESEIAAEAVERQQDELGAAEHRRGQVAAILRRLAVERERKARLKAAFPHARLLERVTAERAGLGDVPRLAHDARARREDVEGRIEDAHRQAKLRRADLERAAQRLAGLAAPSPYAALLQADLDDLHDRLAAERRHRAEHPGLVAVVDELRRQVANGLRHLGLLEQEDGADVDRRLDGLRRAVADRARIKRLARTGETLLRRCEELADAQRSQDEELAALDAATRDRAPTPDPEPLRLALAELGVGPLPSARLVEIEGRREALAAPIEALLRRLGLPGADPKTVAAASVPSAVDVDARRREAGDAARDLARRETEIAAVQAELDAVSADLAALTSVADVPSLDALVEARRRRDEALERLRWLVETRSFGRGGEDLAAVDGLAANVSRVDDLADRLRRETARVERAGALASRRDQLVARRRLLDTQVVARRQAEEDAAARWRASWSEAGVDPRGPEEMATWLRTHDELAARVSERARLDHDASRLEAVVTAAADRLRAGLALVGGAELADLSLPGLVSAAEARVAAVDEDRRGREAEREAREAAATALRQIGQGRVDGDRRQVRWRGEWAEAISSLGCPADAVPEDVLDRLDRAADLVRLHDDLLERSAAERALAAEMAGFAELVDRLPGELGAPAPPGGTAEERCRALLAAAREARKRADDRDALERELARRREEVAVLEAEAAVAEDELGRLFDDAGVADRDALIDAEDRASRARELDADASAARRALVEAADGEAPDPLLRDLEGVAIETLRADLEDLGRDLGEAEDERQELDQTIGSLRNGLRQLVDRAGAAGAAEEAAVEAAAVARHVDRFVELFVAIRVLEAEIERYRSEHQGPVVARAAALFPRLTGGRYEGLSVAFTADDRPVLRAERGDGAALDVDALSDGTRDQLYLALRLATLERWVETGREPLPFVLDDTFVHFDSERSRAALAVLGELAPRFQTLLFTHHDRLVELAEETVPADRLRVHHLG